MYNLIYNKKFVLKHKKIYENYIKTSIKNTSPQHTHIRKQLRLALKFKFIYSKEHYRKLPKNNPLHRIRDFYYTHIVQPNKLFKPAS